MIATVRNGLRCGGVALVVAMSGTIAAADSLDAMAGKALFERDWIPAPSSTDASDGLGPLFNARSCSQCHARGGGSSVKIGTSGHPDLVGAVVRLGTAAGEHDPTYGLQFQTNAIPGLESEAEITFLPQLRIARDGAPLGPGVRTSIRQSMGLVGRAAFDTISDDEILRRADPDDANGDGISGRAHIVPGGIGRFGWKATQISLTDQIAHAFAIDLGLSSPLRPIPYGDCTPRQSRCWQARTGESKAFEGREISGQMIALVATYLASLQAPVPPTNPAADALFTQSGCASCHVPALTSKAGTRVPAYTDLLLHDMGPELNDGVGEPGVAPSEWRTPSLLHGTRTGLERRFLHDGSAATIAEAIAKHGGEGQASRSKFMALSLNDRTRLVDYVKGL